MMRLLAVVLACGMVWGQDRSCLDWPRRETQYEFTLLNTDDTSAAFLTVFKEKDAAIMFGKRNFVIIQASTGPMITDKPLGEVIEAIADYAVACSTRWKAKGWRDLLTKPPYPQHIHPIKQAQDQNEP